VTKRDPKPSGRITLVNYFYETANTSYEESRRITLAPGEGNSLVLEVETDEFDPLKGPRSSQKIRWAIDRDALIDLIKKSGAKTS